MLEIVLFAEDAGHETFLTALIERMATSYGLEFRLRPRSVRGGYGRVIAELTQYLCDLKRGREHSPDLLVIATDANCKGYLKRRQEVDKVINTYSAIISTDRVAHAIPDPHVERWPLLDSAAFKAVLGRGCEAPDYKCERDRYKRLLAEAVRAAGVMPILGGIEHMEDIVNAMDLQKVRSADDSLDRLLGELVTTFGSWASR
jgi:hypothetical protein